jgi:uncharacterized protein (TIGR04255 family)
VDHERFANPPLRAMLGQVQFPVILRLQKGPEVVADFQDAVRGVFPTFGVEHQLQIAIAGPGNAEPAASRAVAYRFTNEEETWSALLSPSSLTLEAVAGGRYSSYEEFSQLFAKLWEAAVEHLRPGKISQQGLRYVDHLEGERSTQEWAEWINPELLGGLAGDVLGPGLERAVCEMLYTDGTDRLVFRHGRTPAGPQNAQGYLLDFDAIHGAAIDPVDIGCLMGRFDESHEMLFGFFRWCVTERALEEFRRVDE